MIKKVILTRFRKDSKAQNFIVQIEHNNKVAELTEIKLIAFQTALWEPLRKKIVFQYRRCQNFGHASSNCRLTPKCIKCGLTDGVNECKIQKDSPRSSLKCANCDQNGHPANYKGCPFYIIALKVAAKNNPTNNGKAPVSHPRQNKGTRSKPVSQGISFTDTLNNRQAPRSWQPNAGPLPPMGPKHTHTGPPPHQSGFVPTPGPQLFQPPPWLIDFKNAMVNEMANMLQDLRRELHSRIDVLWNNMNIIED